MKVFFHENSALFRFGLFQWGLFRNFSAITLANHVFVRGTMSDRLKRHEMAHIMQQWDLDKSGAAFCSRYELGVVVFYTIYLWQFVKNFLFNPFSRFNWNLSYHAISFELEAYAKENDHP